MIKEAAVIAIPDDEVTNRIKVFVVNDTSVSLTNTEIQEYCRNLIPIYMVPETVVFLESLPKTSTGKIDKQCLMNSEE